VLEKRASSYPKRNNSSR
jgi:hypothetical protein